MVDYLSGCPRRALCIVGADIYPLQSKYLFLTEKFACQPTANAV